MAGAIASDGLSRKRPEIVMYLEVDQVIQALSWHQGFKAASGL